MKAVVALLLLAAVAVSAQPSVGCNDKSKPGKPEELRFLSTYINNNAANAYFEWHRPRDAPGNGYPSCINEYSIEVLASNGGRANYGTVKVTDPKHTMASYTAQGLPPGRSYTFTVTPVGPGGIGPTAASNAFNAASLPAPPPSPACKQPSSASNIRRAGAQPAGNGKVSMVIAWDKPTDPDACIKEYLIYTFEAGSNNAIKTTVLPAPNTRFADSMYTLGKAYEFTISARNPSLGVSGNGQTLRSPPIMAPTAAVPL